MIMGIVLSLSVLLFIGLWVLLMLDKRNDDPVWIMLPVWVKAIFVSWVVCTVTLGIGLMFF